MVGKFEWLKGKLRGRLSFLVRDVVSAKYFRVPSSSVAILKTSPQYRPIRRYPICIRKQIHDSDIAGN